MHVQSDGEVELFGQRVDRLHARVVGRHAFVLRGELADHLQAAGGVLLAQEVKVNLCRVPDGVADQHLVRRTCRPAQHRLVVFATADHGFDDVQLLHQGQALGHVRRLVGRRDDLLPGKRVGHRAAEAWVLRLGVHVHVNDGRARGLSLGGCAENKQDHYGKQRDNAHDGLRTASELRRRSDG